MKKIVILLAVTYIAAQFTGCANLTVLRTQELRSIQKSVDSLSSKMTLLQQKLVEEQMANSELLRLIRADQQVRFNELDRKVSSIDGNLSENQVRLSKIDEKTAEVQKKLEAKLTSDSVSASSKNAEIEKLFQIAMSDFNVGRYEIAANGFKDLSAQHPESSVAQDAEYWYAECLYAKKDYVNAEKAYFSYIKKYPTGSKMCVCLYKLGLVYDKQDKEKNKTMVWKKLIEQCPDSQEAKVVKVQLGR